MTGDAARRLLIVDDEEPILLAVSEYFRIRGYAVDAAREKEEAEALLAAGCYAAVIADLRLTGIHGAEGLEILSSARQRWPGTRLLILTGHGSPQVEREAGRRGVDAFLHKPVPLHELAQTLERLLDQP